MGNLVNPKGVRLNKNISWNSLWISYINNNYSFLISSDYLIYKYIEYFLKKQYLNKEFWNFFFSHYKLLRSYNKIIIIIFLKDYKLYSFLKDYINKVLSTYFSDSFNYRDHRFNKLRFLKRFKYCFLKRFKGKGKRYSKLRRFFYFNISRRIKKYIKIYLKLIIQHLWAKQFILPKIRSYRNLFLRKNKKRRIFLYHNIFMKVKRKNLIIKNILKMFQYNTLYNCLYYKLQWKKKNYIKKNYIKKNLLLQKYWRYFYLILNYNYLYKKNYLNNNLLKISFNNLVLKYLWVNLLKKNINVLNNIYYNKYYSNLILNLRNFLQNKFNIKSYIKKIKLKKIKLKKIKLKKIKLKKIKLKKSKLKKSKLKKSKLKKSKLKKSKLKKFKLNIFNKNLLLKILKKKKKKKNKKYCKKSNLVLKKKKLMKFYQKKKKFFFFNISKNKQQKKLIKVSFFNFFLFNKFFKKNYKLDKNNLNTQLEFNQFFKNFVFSEKYIKLFIQTKKLFLLKKKKKMKTFNTNT